MRENFFVNMRFDLVLMIHNSGVNLVELQSITNVGLHEIHSKIVDASEYTVVSNSFEVGD